MTQGAGRRRADLRNSAGRERGRVDRRPGQELQPRAGSRHQFGKNVMPRVAAQLDVAQISEITAVARADTFERPIYAGNAIATVQSSDADQGHHSARHRLRCRAGRRWRRPPIEKVAAGADAGMSSFVGQELSKSDRPELTGARIIVSGGRGMGSGENFKLLNPLADKLGAAVGAVARRGRCRLSCRTTSRSARPARSSRRSCTSPSASPAPSSTWPA